MAQVKVPQADGQILITEGGEVTTYKVKDGLIEVSDAHLPSVLSSVADSALVASKPETPASSSPEAPAKEK